MNGDCKYRARWKKRNGIKMGKKKKKVIRRFGNKTEEDEGEKKKEI